jgi:hypothetical protein
MVPVGKDNRDVPPRRMLTYATGHPMTGNERVSILVSNVLAPPVGKATGHELQKPERQVYGTKFCHELHQKTDQ